MDAPGVDTRVYAGFWVRAGAAIIDTALFAVVTAPFLIWIYGVDYYDFGIEPGDSIEPLYEGPADFVISFVFPVIAVILCWIRWQATPGKMVISARIVDARTGGNPSSIQCVGRYLGYFLSLLPLGIGILWIAFDRRKQGWHDKLARTVVIRRNATGVIDGT